MRISDWSSDVCSSDLALRLHPLGAPARHMIERHHVVVEIGLEHRRLDIEEGYDRAADRIVDQHLGIAAFGRRPIERLGEGGGVADIAADRKSVVQGKSVSVLGGLGGRRLIKKQNKNIQNSIKK